VGGYDGKALSQYLSGESDEGCENICHFNRFQTDNRIHYLPSTEQDF